MLEDRPNPYMIVCWFTGALWVIDALGAPPAVRVATAFVGLCALLSHRVRRRVRQFRRRPRAAPPAGRGGRARPRA